MDGESIKRTLEELQLIQCSLLPNEHLTFLEDIQGWRDALDRYSEDSDSSTHSPPFNGMPSICIRVDETKIRFEVALFEDDSDALVSVKGEDITRKDQERWQSFVAAKMREISGSEFPVYQLVSLYLLPLLHEELQVSQSQKSESKESKGRSDLLNVYKNEPFHALFTSHHLLSVSKRRSLQQWSASLCLSGFAKVGYPGVIYAQGKRSNVEEFVDNVKAMQWLALKVRFVEPLLVTTSENGTSPTSRTWKEFQKVGEVVEEMRRLGREEYVVEMGIGSAGVNTK